MDKPSDFDLLARKILDSLNSKYFIEKTRKGEGDEPGIGIRSETLLSITAITFGIIR
ncbi:MAG: hypothetical protein ACXU99_06800 [Thermodesulfobacteriota bacterium]